MDIYFSKVGIVFEFFNESDVIFLDLYKKNCVKEEVFTSLRTCSFMDTTVRQPIVTKSMKSDIHIFKLDLKSLKV